MKLYACQVRFQGDYGYTEDEITWELCTQDEYGKWEVYTRMPYRYYNGHEILEETAIPVTNLAD